MRLCFLWNNGEQNHLTDWPVFRSPLSDGVDVHAPFELMFSL